MHLTLVTEHLLNAQIGKLYETEKYLKGLRNPIMFSIEKAWRNNKPNISCIPAGTYQLIQTKSPKYGNRYHLEAPTLGVFAKAQAGALRTHCLIHPANYEEELKGCIAFGLETRASTKRARVVSSTLATATFEEMLDKSSTQCLLTIVRA